MKRFPFFILIFCTAISNPFKECSCSDKNKPNKLALEHLQSQKKLLQKQSDDLTTDITEKKTQVQQLESLFSQKPDQTQKEQLNQIKQELQQKEESLSQVNTKLTQLNEQLVAQLEAQKKELEAQQNNNVQNDQKANETRGKLEFLDSELKQLREEHLAQLEAQKKELEAQKKNMVASQEANKQLTDNLRQVNEDIMALKKLVNEQTKKITSLKDNDLQRNVKKKEKKLNKNFLPVDHEIEEKNNRLNNLREKQNKIQEEYDNMQTEYADLLNQRGRADLEARQATMCAELKTKENELLSIQCQISELEQALNQSNAPEASIAPSAPPFFEDETPGV